VVDPKMGKTPHCAFLVDDMANNRSM